MGFVDNAAARRGTSSGSGPQIPQAADVSSVGAGPVSGDIQAQADATYGGDEKEGDKRPSFWERTLNIGNAWVRAETTNPIDAADMRMLNMPGAAPWKGIESGFNQKVTDGTGFERFDFSINQGVMTPSNGQQAMDYYTTPMLDGDPSAPAAREKRAFLQDLLWRAGFVDRKDPEPKGGWGSPLDTAYETAWRRAVELAMDTHTPLFVLLNNEAAYLAAQGGPGGGSSSSSGGGGGGPKRPTVQVISDEDASELIDNISKNELGRKLSDDERKVATSIIKAMQGKQASEQNAIIDQSMKGGGTVQNQTNPQTTAKNEVNKRFEGESKAYDLARAFADLLGMTGA